MTIRTMIRCWFGDTLRLGASPPNLVSSPPAPSSSGKKLFSAYGPLRLSLKNGHSSYYIDFIGLFGHNDPYNRIYPTALKGDAL